MSNALVLAVAGLAGMYLIADMSGVDLLSALSTFVVALIFQPFYHVFKTLQPVIGALARNGFRLPAIIFNFFVDCVIAAAESLQSVCERFGL